MKFTEPTPIQAAAIPEALMGHDILGSAQTGTGKTGAFGIPLIARLMESNTSTALVVTPTRELATQVMKALKDMLGHKSKINTALIIGGESMGKQMAQLRKRPRLFVGTPGRLNDHLRRGTIKLHKNEFLVLDETDRMLDMGFSVQIEEILEHMPQERQTMLFSATLPKNIMNIAKNYMTEPKRISVGETNTAAKNIKQEVIKLAEKDKYEHLLGELHEREGSVIVFVKTKFGAERMAKKLRGQELQADAVHGDLKHSKRERVIRDFRKNKYRILVATDVAARGLDIPHIEHVINYDLPQCPEDYIHRIGRTARAGAEGEALNLVTPKDGRLWHAIVKLIDPDSAANDSAPRKGGKKDKSKWSKKRKSRRDSEGRGGRGRRDSSSRRDDRPAKTGKKDSYKKSRDGYKSVMSEVTSGDSSSERRGGNDNYSNKRREGSQSRRRNSSEGFKGRRDGSSSNGRGRSEGFSGGRDRKAGSQAKRSRKPNATRSFEKRQRRKSRKAA